MSKIKSPLFSMECAGSIGSHTTYSTWKKQPTAKRYKKPLQPDTASQIAHKTAFSDCVTLWKNCSSEPFFKPSWDLLAKYNKDTLSAFNHFMKLYFSSLSEGKTFVPNFNATIDWNGATGNLRVPKTYGIMNVTAYNDEYGIISFTTDHEYSTTWLAYLEEHLPLNKTFTLFVFLDTVSAYIHTGHYVFDTFGVYSNVYNFT